MSPESAGMVRIRNNEVPNEWWVELFDGREWLMASPMGDHYAAERWERQLITALEWFHDRIAVELMGDLIRSRR